MDEQLSADKAGRTQFAIWLRGFGWLLLGFSILLLVTAVVLPTHTLAWLRSDYIALGRPLNWLEAVSPVVDLEHVLLFCGIGLLLRSLSPKMPWRLFAAWMLVLAVGSEILQFLVPGRDPRLTDLRDDLLGAVIGSICAIGIGWLLRERGCDDRTEART